MVKYALVKCADGYEVIFSLAELDPSIADKKAILADHLDGHELPADRGPFRLIVPDEKKAARSAFKVQEIIIGTAKD